MASTHRSVVGSETERQLLPAQNNSLPPASGGRTVAPELRKLARILAIIGLTVVASDDAAAEPVETAALDPRSPMVREVPLARMSYSSPSPAPGSFDLDTSGDIMAGRGRQRIRSALLQIAIQASLGNRDAVEISSDQLRKFGVSREEIEDAMAWAKIHSGH
jgi:hypothetical protein